MASLESEIFVDEKLVAKASGSFFIMTGKRLFDEWVDTYDRWFATPIGKLVKEYEEKLVLELLQPSGGEIIPP